MTDVAHLDPVSFRSRVLYGQFQSLQEGDTVYVTIMPDFVKMYATSDLFQQGHVYQIIEPDYFYNERDPRYEKPTDSRLVVVRTPLGRFTFRQNGLSLNRICQLSMYVRATGKRLDLYEPVFVDRPPPTES